MATTAMVSEAEQPPVVALFVEGPPSPLQDFQNELRRVMEASGLRTRTVRTLLNQTAAASGFSNKQVVELFGADQASAQAWASALGMLQRPGRSTRVSEFAALLGALEASRPWAAVSDPHEALLRFLERLMRLGKRADAARQLAVQRHQLARHAVATTPDRPPGELVVSSARVPRGPDLARVAPAQTVEAIRGRHLVAA